MTGFATVPTHNPGDTFPSADWNTVAANLNSGGVMIKIADTTLGAGATTISFTSIPQTFAHLLLMFRGGSDLAATTEQNLLMRLNADSATNYHWAGTRYNNGVNSVISSFGATSFYAGPVNGATFATPWAGSSSIFLPHYTSTTFYKSLIGSANLNLGSAANAWQDEWSGTYISTTALTQIQLLLGSGGNIVTGSRATLYGLPQ